MNESHAIVQVVLSDISPQRHTFDARLVHLDIVVDKLALENVSVRVFIIFYASYLSTNAKKNLFIHYRSLYLQEFKASLSNTNKIKPIKIFCFRGVCKTHKGIEFIK
jgi:hypothetical protein